MGWVNRSLCQNKKIKKIKYLQVGNEDWTHKVRSAKQNFEIFFEWPATIYQSKLQSAVVQSFHQVDKLPFRVEYYLKCITCICITKSITGIWDLYSNSATKYEQISDTMATKLNRINIIICVPHKLTCQWILVLCLCEQSTETMKERRGYRSTTQKLKTETDIIKQI